jgi:D-galacturonate reductase
VGLTCFDLRRLGKINELGMVGVNGKKFPQIREHLQDKIGNVYKDMDVGSVLFACYLPTTMSKACCL